MLFKLFKRKIANISLQSILTLPFLLQIFVTVGLVGYVSFRNGQQAINQVSSKLRNEVSLSLKQHLHNYLEKPCLIVKLNQKSARLGQISFDDWRKIEKDFWQQFQIFDSVYAIYLGDESGKFAYVKREKNNTFIAKPVKTPPKRQAYLLDEKGERSQLLEADSYDPRIRHWYVVTSTNHSNNWSQIYTFAGGELGMTIAGELYDSKNNFRGVLGVDLLLNHIGDFLESIKISESGQVFILERNGSLVATSTGEKPFIYNPISNEEQRLKGIDSNNPFTQVASNYLVEHFDNLNSIQETQQLDFKLEGERQLIQVFPYGQELGLDWLIVMVMPEADFMSDINRNTRNTILLCLGAFAIAIIVGIITSRKIAQPIKHLGDVSKIIADSAKANSTATDFYPIVKTKSIKELNILAQSFNEMAIQLKAAFRQLATTNEELEVRVEQRTSALMAAKETADAANLAKSEFLAQMSHELRTPLHAILGFTQVSLKDSSLSIQQRKNLATVKKSGEHLLTLINDVLEMSKIESGTVSVKLQIFDFHLFLAKLAKTLGLKAQDKNLALVLSVSPQIPQYIQTDPAKLSQILSNLLENSIKFTQQGKISLKVLSGEKNKLNQIPLYCEVEDTGCGIPSSELDTIFEPFVKTKQFSHGKGTGLGLAISQHFARILGGKITVSSVLNQGSTFRVHFPVTVIDNKDVPLLINEQQSSNLSQLLSVKTTPHEVAKPRGSLSVTDRYATQINCGALRIMPKEWISRLEKAAIEVDADSIEQLLKQIPSSHASLAQGLNNMLKNFEYDEIIQLAELSK